MSDEPNQPTPPQPEEKPAEPSAIAPPVIVPSAEAPPIIPQGKPASPANFNQRNVITIFRCIIAFGIPVLGGLALAIPRFFWDDWNWREVWMVILLVCCGLFAVMSVMVIIGGAFDVRKLLRRLREQETGGEPDTSE